MSRDGSCSALPASKAVPTTRRPTMSGAGLGAENPAEFGGKAYSLLSVDGVLYTWRCGDADGKSSLDFQELYRSTNHSATWRTTRVRFTQSSFEGDDLRLLLPGVFATWPRLPRRQGRLRLRLRPGDPADRKPLPAATRRDHADARAQGQGQCPLGLRVLRRLGRRRRAKLDLRSRRPQPRLLRSGKRHHPAYRRRLQSRPQSLHPDHRA